jgi:hypothetical protein
LLESNLKKISWNYLSLNPNPNIMHIWKKYINSDKYHCGLIFYNYISLYPSIFEFHTYDYYEISKRMSIIHEELIQKSFHPSRIQKCIEADFEF